MSRPSAAPGRSGWRPSTPGRSGRCGPPPGSRTPPTTTRYVVDLVAPGTVNTMPEATLRAVADHGVVRGNTIRGTYADAKQIFDDLASVGVDLTDVVTCLENDGVATFQASWRELQADVASALATGGPDD